MIEGLTPTVDEHSIKVEGTGAATITDMTVQLIANREIFEDIYPDEDEDDEDSEDENANSDQEDDATKAVTAEIKKLNEELGSSNEEIDSASARLAMLERYSTTIASKRPDDLEKCLKDYSDERAKAFADQRAAVAKSEELMKKIDQLNKKKALLGKAALKAKLKIQAEKRKKEAKKQRQLEEARQEKARVKAERVKFWPKKVYKVIVSLDAPFGDTPASSRRGSVESLVKIASPKEAGPSSEASHVGEINLSLSYITYSASWSPRYDLSLNSVTSSGVLDYCAELKNTTSETWKDTKVVLSTSQTSYQGLGDTIPVLQPWHVRLIKNAYGKNASFGSNGKAPALYSQYEQDQKAKNRNEIPAQIFAPRNELFGLSDGGPMYQQQQQQRPQVINQQVAPQAYQQVRSSALLGGGELMRSAPAPKRTYLAQTSNFGQPSGFGSQATLPFGNITSKPFSGNVSSQPFDNVISQASDARSFSNNQAPAPFGNMTSQASAQTNLFGAATEDRRSGTPTASAAFGSAAPPSTLANYDESGMSKKSAGLFGSFAGRGGGGPPPPPAPGAAYEAEIDQSSEGTGAYDEDDATISATDPALLFEESSFSDSGLTTTYDVPSLKTLAPASSTTKHKIARIDFKSVLFSHILIPKLKASAFLKARLRNASKIALLKGPAGLTLDGSFMGQSTIPRCSAGDSFTLPLGVDPTISVSYAKPTVRRSQSGIFSKEDCEVYTRQVTVSNTKHNTPVEVQVLDQVPISEDERLRIEVVSPRGLRLGGDAVPAGMAAVSGGEGDGDAGLGVNQAAKSRTSVYGDNGVRASGTGRDVGKWGSAIATAKKDGEVNWSVKINPLRGCKLLLEYEATYPGGEQVSGIN